MDVLQTLDTRVYLALATTDLIAAKALGLFFAAFATLGLGWWAFALLGVRARGWGPRGQRILFTTLLGGWGAWLIGEWLKTIMRRPRPFLANNLDALVRPTSFSLPSGDTAMAFGAATALALTWPAARLPALLVACAVGLSRIVVGAHYPSDVLAGAALGIAIGFLANRIWLAIARRNVRTFVVAEPTEERARYLEADALLGTGESMVRHVGAHLEAGRSVAKVALGLGRFGHSGQLPQVLRGFGYDDYVFTGGVGGERDALGNVFSWQAPSGDRVRATYLSGSPGQSDVSLALALTDAPTPETLEDYAAALDVPRTSHAGELASGRDTPTFIGARSSRVWIKQESAACERLLLERCEPLAVFSGEDVRGELRALWNALLEARTHDLSCACVIDAKHDAFTARGFAAVRSDAEQLSERLMARLVGASSVPMVWNARPTPRVVVVEIDGVPRAVECAPLGLAPLVPFIGASVVSSPGAGILENDRYRVEVGADGSFIVIDRRSRAVTGRLNVLSDEGDRGDLFTHEFAGPTVSARGMAGALLTEVRGDRGRVTVDLALLLPKGLRADRLARVAETVICPVRVTVTLDGPAEHVEVTIDVDNNAHDHRLRARFETGLRALTHQADDLFGSAVRSNRLPGGRNWRERPNGDHATEGLVTIGNASRGLVLGLDGIREYGVSDDGSQIAVTLVRAVGWASRGDLRVRRGHVGTDTELPSAQCLGPRTYRYVVVPFGGPQELVHAERIARDALSPVVHTTGTGERHSFAQLEGAAVELSALHPGANGSMVVRLCSRAGESSTAVLSVEGRIRTARAVDLREGECDPGSVIRTAAPPEVRDGRMVVELAPHEVGTYVVTH